MKKIVLCALLACVAGAGAIETHVPVAVTNASSGIAVPHDAQGPDVMASANLPPPATNNPPPVVVMRPLGPNELRLNFHGAPLDLVLNYFSEAAGLIIQMNTSVHGTVDVWCEQPVSKEEAVNLLNTVLDHNGYAAVRSGRILTIMSRDDALHGNIPVKISADPSAIPQNDEMVTHIIPVRFVEAEQLVKDLAPMVSPRATIIANADGNSIVVTDTQASIHHLAEIIKAIDTSAEDVVEIHVYGLKHHDPGEVATLLNNLFSDQTSATGAQMPFRFGGPAGGGRPMPVPAASTAGKPGSPADRIKKRARVVAVSDPRTDSVVVSCSKDMSAQIATMIAQLDQESPKVAHVSVIHLENADPVQVQQVLQDMFQNGSSTRSSSSSQSSPLQTRVQQSTATTSSGTGLNSGSSRSGMGSGFPSF